MKLYFSPKNFFVNRQFTVRQLLILCFVIGTMLAWFSWREIWETKRVIRALDAREKTRDDGMVVWELYMKEKTVYSDARGLEVAPPIIDKWQVGCVLLIVFLISSATLARHQFTPTSLAKEIAIAGCALPVLILLIEATILLWHLPESFPRVR